MRQRFSLVGKRVLITGASGGLGAHCAEMMALEGAIIAVAARRIDACNGLVSRIEASGGKAASIKLDVANPESVRNAMETMVSAFGGIDVLVNNAGIASGTALKSTTELDWDRVIDTNLKGAFLVGKAAAEVMQKNGGGSIINIASILGLRVAGHVAAYAASKAGLIQLTKAMALEWARDKIRVNALCPGYIETDINREFFKTEGGQAVIRRIPMRRLGNASDLDGALLLLASNAGAYMTGSTIVVDGGHLVSSL